MDDLERLRRDNAYMADLLERADALITGKNAILDRVRREFVLLMLATATAGFVAGICVAQMVARL